MWWTLDWNTLSDIGTVAAVVVSLAAIYMSQRGESARGLREKKEELRGVLERLIELREQHNSLKEKDEAIRAFVSSSLNVKRSIYLEAAESIAKSIPDDVTGSEYYVIALENHWDSDLVDAQTYYELAAQHADTSSPTKRSEILRSLAWMYFNENLQSYEKGRTAFSNSINALSKMNDPYTLYVRMLGYRAWAEAELRIHNLQEACRLLSLAYEEWLKIPTGNAGAWIADLRQIANDWTYIGVACFHAKADSSENFEKGRNAFAESEKVLRTLFETHGVSNDYGIDALCFLLHSRAQEEHRAGSPEEGQRLLARAEQEFQRLSDDFPWKSFRRARHYRERFSPAAAAAGRPCAGRGTPPGPCDLVTANPLGQTPEDLIRQRAR